MLDSVATHVVSPVLIGRADQLSALGAALAEARRGADTARARLFEQMLILVERLAERGPLVLVVEDAHWADRSTRDLLAFLIRNQGTLDGLLIVVTYRSDELHRKIGPANSLPWTGMDSLPAPTEQRAEVVSHVEHTGPGCDSAR